MLAAAGGALVWIAPSDQPGPAEWVWRATPAVSASAVRAQEVQEVQVPRGVTASCAACDADERRGLAAAQIEDLLDTLAVAVPDDPATHDHLVGLLQHPLVEVRVQAVQALADARGNHRDVSAIRVALDDADPQVWSAAVQGLSRLGDDQAILALGQQATMAATAKQRVQALDALADLPGAAVEPWLWRAAGDADPKVAAVAQEWLDERRGARLRIAN